MYLLISFIISETIGPWMSAFSYGTSYFSAVIFIGYAGMLGWDKIQPWMELVMLYLR